jgi:hypothetical protein
VLQGCQLENLKRGSGVKRNEFFIWGLSLLFLAGASLSGRARDEPVPLAVSREKVLRCVSPDAAVVLYAQDLHTRWHELSNSPFLRVFPDTELGREVQNAFPWRALLQNVEPIFRELKTTPQELLEDVFGQAVVFSYTPAQERPPRPPTSLLVLAPRRPARLQTLIQRINELQIQSGEVTAVEQRRQDRFTYFVRKKGSEESDYYAFHEGLFLYSSRESELQDALRRLEEKEPVSPWCQRWQRWGWHEMTFILAVEPRSWDAQWASRIQQAHDQDKALLQHWSQLWLGFEAVAIGLQLHRGVDVHVVLEVNPQRLPQPWQRWWSASAPSTPHRLFPPDAWLVVQGYGRLADWLERLDVLLPQEQQRAISQWFEQSVGPLLGRDHFPAVRDCLGPHWALWVEPPGAEDALPLLAFVVSVQGEKDQRQQATRVLCQALTFAFHAYRVRYNATHDDQITWVEPKGGAVGLSGMLVNERGFPAGLAPCFSVIQDHIILASSPAALERLAQRLQQPPASSTLAPATASAAWPVAMVQVRGLQEYLQRRSELLARALAPLLGWDQQDMSQQLRRLATLLEPIDSIQLVYERKERRICWTFRCQLRWPLQPEK